MANTTRKDENEALFNQILDLIPQDKKGIAKSLINEIKFLKYVLQNLKDIIKNNGVVENFINGKQNFTREAPALKSYNSSIQQYSRLYKQLTDLIPDKLANENSELLNFLKEG